MTPTEQPGRPTLPHAMRRPTTDRARTLPPDDAETVPAELAEVLQVLRDPSGFSIESVLKLLQYGQRYATAATRQTDKLGVDLGVGKISEQLGSIQGSIAQRRRIRDWVMIAALVISAALAAGQGVWNIVAPAAHREAAEVVLAPAVRAEAKVLTLEERVAATEQRHEETDRALRSLDASVDDLQAAVVALTKKLDTPREGG